MNRRTSKLALIAISALSAIGILWAPFVGPTELGLNDLRLMLSGGEADEAQRQIFFAMRVPRVALGFLTGAGLALAGAAFQALFRNALATPYTLGVANGAAFGATLAIRLELHAAVLGLSAVSWFSLGGALISIALVYAISQIRQFSGATMLLAGVAISLFFSSLILFVQYMTDLSQSFEAIRWLMGGLEVLGFGAVKTILPFVLLGTGAIFYLHRELDLIATGEELAVSRGVSVRRCRVVLFFCTSLMVGGIVSITGPIGFIGLMAPHICRLLVGGRHLLLVPASAAFGGAFLVLCDCLARTLIQPAELPVGVLTALLGGPFFLWLLLRKGAERHLF